MGLRKPIVLGEWYHCFNRGVERRIIFEEPRDYERFMSLLYLCNGPESIHISDIKEWSLTSFLHDDSYRQPIPIVELGAYALMPNHFHLIMQEIKPGGIALFMRKVCTGYSMYFNTKRHRTGTLLTRPFKSRHIYDNAYLQTAVPYVLLNPAELFDPGWKSGNSDIQHMTEGLLAYPYSSLPDFIGKQRLETKIVGTKLLSYFESIPTLNEMLRNAQEYYHQNSSIFL